MEQIQSFTEHTLYPCTVCSAQSGATNGTKVIYEQAKDYITEDNFSVVGCSKCSLAWTVPVPSNLDPYYPKSYRRYTPIILFILKTLYRNRVKGWSNLFSKPGSALELGCGDGFMINALRELGWDVTGTERTSMMATFAREHFNLNVVVEEEGQKLEQGKQYDLIIMFQVLEHLIDPVKELKRARSLLKPDGKLVVGVPNFSSWQSKFARQGWFHLDVPRHLFHHSPESAKYLASATGLRIDNINFVSFEHDPYGWVQSILNRCFSNKNRLTKLLMRSTSFKTSDVFTFILASLLTPFALILSTSSWILNKGAIMQLVFSRSE